MRALAPQTMRRFTEHAPPFESVDRLDPDHPAAVAATSRYPRNIAHPGMVVRLLKSGHNNRKIGKRVEKGRWRGMALYTLTLTERATCPHTCRHWLDCFGNQMHWPQRLAHGRPLEWSLGSELRELCADHPNGFVVRLHVLGDFYSVAYVRRWLAWIARLPQLHAFGYTAWPAETPIGALIRNASDRLWDRFAIRTSNGPQLERSTRTLYVPPSDHVLPDGSIVCPAQTGRASCCATCALCWQTRRPIAFLAH